MRTRKEIRERIAYLEQVRDNPPILITSAGGAELPVVSREPGAVSYLHKTAPSNVRVMADVTAINTELSALYWVLTTANPD